MTVCGRYCFPKTTTVITSKKTCTNWQNWINFGKWNCTLQHAVSLRSQTKKKNPGNSDYKLHNHTLEHEVSTIYQNCFITNDQDLVEDINHLSVKASRCLGFLHRNLNINSKSIKWLAYKTFVKAQMEFDTTVWDATLF